MLVGWYRGGIWLRLIDTVGIIELVGSSRRGKADGKYSRDSRGRLDARPHH